MVILLDCGVGVVEFDLGDVELLLPFVDAPLGGVLVALGLREFGVPLFQLGGECGLLLRGVPGGVLQLLKGLFAPGNIFLSGGDPVCVFLLGPLGVFQGVLKGGDLFLLLVVDGGEGPTLCGESLHAVGVPLKGGGHEVEIGAKDGKLRLDGRRRPLIFGLALNGEFCRDRSYCHNGLLPTGKRDILLDIPVKQCNNILGGVLYEKSSFFVALCFHVYAFRLFFRALRGGDAHPGADPA